MTADAELTQKYYAVEHLARHQLSHTSRAGRASALSSFISPLHLETFFAHASDVVSRRRREVPMPYLGFYGLARFLCAIAYPLTRTAITMLLFLTATVYFRRISPKVTNTQQNHATSIRRFMMIRLSRLVRGFRHFDFSYILQNMMIFSLL